MIIPSERKLMCQRFSDAACGYGTHADIQMTLAQELVGGLSFIESVRALDIGAGDGAAAGLMARGGADVVALDVAWGMVDEGRRRCPQAAWVQADACAMPFGPGIFDVAVSSSAYQWVDDLDAAFSEVRRVLRPRGHFSAAMFGRGTLEEFFVSLERAAQGLGRRLPRLRRMAAGERVEKALSAAGFRDVKVSGERRIAVFSDLRAILRWLQGIGANGLARDFFWGKALLAATEKEYRAAFARDGRLCASFEIIWIEARA